MNGAGFAMDKPDSVSDHIVEVPEVYILTRSIETKSKADWQARATSRWDPLV